MTLFILDHWFWTRNASQSRP